MRNRCSLTSLLLAVFLLYTSLLSPPLAWSKVYPWTAVSEEDIEIIPNNALEAPLRIRLIEEAQQRIDIIVYDQRSDELHAIPLLLALRDAADRGVRIRFLTNWLPRALGDADAIAPKFLTSPRPKGIVEYFMVGGTPALGGGWMAGDGVHEKILIVDGKVLLTTGRGFGGPYDHWLDTAYLIRGNLVAQAQQAFDDIYYIVRKKFEKFRPQGPLGEARREHLRIVGRTTLNSNRITLPGIRANELTAWSFSPPRCNNPQGPIEECGPTVRGRLLHNEVIRQVAEIGPWRLHNLQLRLKHVRDDILESVISRVDQSARSVEFTTLSTLTPVNLRKAFAAAVRRGVAVTGYTNGARAYEDIGPWPLPWTVGLYSMRNLLDDGVSVKKFVRPNLESRYTFLHRKVALFDEQTIIFGSHNLNLPSSTNNDEISFEIESPKLNAELRSIFEKERSQNYFEDVSREEVTKDSETWSALFQRMIARPIINLF